MDTTRPKISWKWYSGQSAQRISAPSYDLFTRDEFWVLNITLPQTSSTNFIPIHSCIGINTNSYSWYGYKMIVSSEFENSTVQVFANCPTLVVLGGSPCEPGNILEKTCFENISSFTELMNLTCFSH